MPTFFTKLFNRDNNFQAANPNLLIKTDDHLKSEILDNFDREIAQMFSPVKVKTQFQIENLLTIEVATLNVAVEAELNKIAKISTKLKDNKLLQNLFSISYEFGVKNQRNISNYKFELKGNTIQWSIIFTKTVLNWLKTDLTQTEILKCELEGKGSREKEAYYLSLSNRTNNIQIENLNTTSDVLFDGLN